jgi:DDE superfamily endonuclease
MQRGLKHCKRGAAWRAPWRVASRRDAFPACSLDLVGDRSAPRQEVGGLAASSLAKGLPPMPTMSPPCSLADLLKGLRPCFTAPTFRTFQALVGGFLAQPGLRTVTGMLVGARLAGRCHHARAHRFFAAARWQADQLGLAVCDLIVARLLDADAPTRSPAPPPAAARCR